MREYTVTYWLSEEQETRIMKLIEGEPDITLEQRFNTLMVLGSSHDINDKIKFWEFMAENEKRKRTEAKAEC